MSLRDFSLVKSVFGGGKCSGKDEDELFSELLFMVLARASAADLNIESVEVDLIVTILNDHLGKDFTPADIRIAANTELYRQASLEKYVSKCSKNLPVERRLNVLAALAHLFKSDGTTGVLETDFFNSIANALSLTPAQLYRL